jgi:hypothetical protein
MHEDSEGKQANIEGDFWITGSRAGLRLLSVLSIQVCKDGWIPYPGSSSSMPLSRRITNHDEIRTWAASCQAVPAEVSPGREDEPLPIIRFMFLDGSPNQPELTPISWEDFFSKFDRLGLVLLCEDNASGESVKAYDLQPSE